VRTRHRFIVLATVGCLLAPGTAARGTDAGPPLFRGAAPVDTLVDVGGHRLHLRVRRGTRPITVLFEAGGAADLRSWGPVPERLAERTKATIATFDRAGLGESDLGPMALTPGEEVRDIRRALALLKLPPRTIVVGHSYGAMLALAQAAAFPKRVAGLVLVDPMNPRFIEATGDFVKSTAPAIPHPETNREHVIVRMARTLDSLAAALLASEPKLDLPMVIISAGEDWWGKPDIDAAWRRSHRAMADAAPNRRRVISKGSGHDIPHQDPEAIVSAVLSLLEGRGRE